MSSIFSTRPPTHERTKVLLRFLESADASAIAKGEPFDQTDFTDALAFEVEVFRKTHGLTTPAAYAELSGEPWFDLFHEASERAPRRPQPIAKAATDEKPDLNTAVGQLELLTRTMRRDWPKLTEQQARARVLKENPAIYDAL